MLESAETHTSNSNDSVMNVTYNWLLSARWPADGNAQKMSWMMLTLTSVLQVFVVWLFCVSITKPDWKMTQEIILLKWSADDKSFHLL